MKAAIALALLLCLSAWPQPKLAPGVLLVAHRDLEDPNFHKTVILIVQLDDEGALGLILNRQTDLKISEVLKKWKESAKVDDPLFIGGPVGQTGMFALLRTKAAPAGARKVVSDIHLVMDRPGLAAHLSDGPEKVRLYAGYTGWGPEQLEDEIEGGAWHVLPANPQLIFDPDPESLWNRLIRTTEIQLATANPSVSHSNRSR